MVIPPRWAGCPIPPSSARRGPRGRPATTPRPAGSCFAGDWAKGGERRQDLVARQGTAPVVQPTRRRSVTTVHPRGVRAPGLVDDRTCPAPSCDESSDFAIQRRCRPGNGHCRLTCRGPLVRHGLQRGRSKVSAWSLRGSSRPPRRPCPGRIPRSPSLIRLSHPGCRAGPGS